MNTNLKAGDTVKYSKPEAGEEDIRFILREVNGERVLIELVCDWAIHPTEVVLLSDICKA